MNEWLKLIFISALCLGAWTSVNLWVNHAGPQKIRLLVSVLILILLIPPCVGYLQLVNGEVPRFVLFVRTTLTWWYGPLMYFITREMLLLPSTKQHIINHICGVCFLLVVTSVITDNTLPYSYFVVLTATVLGYCLLAGLIIASKVKLWQRINSSYRKSTFYWLQYLLGGLLLLCAIDVVVVVAMYRGLQLDYAVLNAIACIFAFYVNGIVLFALIKPKLLVLEAQDEQGVACKEPKEPPGQRPEETTNNTNVRYLELSEQVAEALISTLTEIMERDKPYLEPDENLASMAARLGISAHMFSELLNVHLNTNFYDWMNSYRYRAALALLQDLTTDYSVTDIAFQAGFNNRNSFYRVFKLNQGVTPTQYRKEYRVTVQQQA